MMTDENMEAVLIILEYAANIKEPRRRCKKSYFKELSYSRWATEEILNAVMEHNDKSPVAVLEEFVSQMYMYSTKRENTGLIFSVAISCAMDILDILYAME